MWVFEKDPEMGLKLFTSERNQEQDIRSSYVGAVAGQSISSMPVDDVIVFLEKL